MTIHFSKQAEKYLQTLPKTTALNLLEKIEQLPKGDVKPLSGRPGEFRFRFSRFRVLFYIEKTDIMIFKIDTRGDVYKK